MGWRAPTLDERPNKIIPGEAARQRKGILGSQTPQFLFPESTEGYNPQVGRARTHASRDFRDAISQIRILETRGRQPSLRRCEHPPGTHCRIAHIPRSEGFETLGGPPFIRFCDLCFSRRVCMRHFFFSRQLLTQNPIASICHPRRDSRSRSFHC